MITIVVNTVHEAAHCAQLLSGNGTCARILVGAVSQDETETQQKPLQATGLPSTSGSEEYWGQLPASGAEQELALEGSGDSDCQFDSRGVTAPRTCATAGQPRSHHAGMEGCKGPASGASGELAGHASQCGKPIGRGSASRDRVQRGATAESSAASGRQGNRGHTSSPTLAQVHGKHRRRPPPAQRRAQGDVGAPASSEGGSNASSKRCDAEACQGASPASETGDSGSGTHLSEADSGTHPGSEADSSEVIEQVAQSAREARTSFGCARPSNESHVSTGSTRCDGEAFQAAGATSTADTSNADTQTGSMRCDGAASQLGMDAGKAGSRSCDGHEDEEEKVEATARPKAGMGQEFTLPAELVVHGTFIQLRCARRQEPGPGRSASAPPARSCASADDWMQHGPPAEQQPVASTNCVGESTEHFLLTPRAGQQELSDGSSMLPSGHASCGDGVPATASILSTREAQKFPRVLTRHSSDESTATGVTESAASSSPDWASTNGAQLATLVPGRSPATKWADLDDRVDETPEPAAQPCSWPAVSGTVVSPFAVPARTIKLKRKADRKKERRQLQQQLHECDHEKMKLMAKSLRCGSCGMKQLEAVRSEACMSSCTQCDDICGAGITCTTAGCLHFTCLKCRLDEYDVNAAYWTRRAAPPLS